MAINIELRPVADDEWIRNLRQWANDFPGQTPILTDEAMSPESIYGDGE